MAKRILKATVPGTAAGVIERLAAVETFPPYAPDLLSVTRDDTHDDTHDGTRDALPDGDSSAWVVAFRGGLARWTQRQRVTAGRIDFEQVDGDFQRYAGHWTATDGPDGCEVEFGVDYRTSVPHFAGAIESAIGRVLARTALAVLTGACGPVHLTKGQHVLRDLPEGSLPDAVR